MSAMLDPITIKRMIDAGVPEQTIIDKLVETGVWSKQGARSIVSSLRGEPLRRDANERPATRGVSG